jgi:preprotein translocase SecE subunit
MDKSSSARVIGDNPNMKRILNLPKSIANYLREVAAELKAMRWLSLNQTVQFTLTVVMIAALMVLILVSLDGVMVAGRSLLLNRI